MDIVNENEKRGRGNSKFKKPLNKGEKEGRNKSKGKNQMVVRRDERLNQKDQRRRDKLDDFLFKKRGLIDEDSETPISKSINISNLSMLADKNHYITPPKLCAVIPLNSSVDLDKLSNRLHEVLMSSSTSTQPLKMVKIHENMWTTLVPTNLSKGKERLSFFNIKRDEDNNKSYIYKVLDLCKVADIIVFVSSCVNKSDPDYYNKIKTSPESCGAIDLNGHNVLSMLRAQGMLPHMGVIADIDTVPDKYRTEVKRLFTRFFESELQANKVIATQNDDDYKGIIRHLCSLSLVDKQINLRKHRSFMLVERFNYKQDKSELEISGYLRGNTLNGTSKIHITGFGDYEMGKVEFDTDPCENKHYIAESTSENMELDNKSKVIYEKGQNIIQPEDLIEPAIGANLGNKPTVVLATGGTTVQMNATRPEDVFKDLEKLDKMINLDEKEDEDDMDLEDISYDENQDNNDNEEAQKVSKKHIANTNLQYRCKEDMEFKDEVDTPIGMNARDRFIKYRGLESMKTGTWNIHEDLPEEFKHIYTFENFKQTSKSIIKKTHESGLKISGNFIKITLKNFGKENLDFIKGEYPFVLSTLLEHERKLTVSNFRVKINYDYKESVVSKEVYEGQIGFRRWIIKPTFSSEISVNCDKLRYEKNLEAEKTYIASIYGQLTYPDSPVLFFKPLGNHLEFAMHGVVLEPDFKQIILKKIILTGYPVKIKKKKVVARYMFFNPDDINYFKPVQLTTKFGLRGHITESLGTHGYMKCIFNNYMKQNDTICMNLYKRVFPKWLVETWKYKVYYGNRQDYQRVIERHEIDKSKYVEELEEKKEMNLD